MILSVTGADLPLKQKYGFHVQGPSAFTLARQPSPDSWRSSEGGSETMQVVNAQANVPGGKNCFCIQK
ncbi:MAG: hypothetical protein AAGK77_07530 [Pseudomonadota bacterium]